MTVTPPPRKIRVCYLNAWTRLLEDARQYVARAPQIDLTPFLSNPCDPTLRVKARLDCDWYAENTRCFATLTPPKLEFLPAWVCGKETVLDVARAPREVPDEERWLVTMGQQPQMLGPVA